MGWDCLAYKSYWLRDHFWPTEHVQCIGLHTHQSQYFALIAGSRGEVPTDDQSYRVRGKQIRVSLSTARSSSSYSLPQPWKNCAELLAIVNTSGLLMICYIKLPIQCAACFRAMLVYMHDGVIPFAPACVLLYITFLLAAAAAKPRSSDRA